MTGNVMRSSVVSVK